MHAEHAVLDRLNRHEAAMAAGKEASLLEAQLAQQRHDQALAELKVHSCHAHHVKDSVVCVVLLQIFSYRNIPCCSEDKARLHSIGCTQCCGLVCHKRQ